jgi:hypothetical protein
MSIEQKPGKKIERAVWRGTGAVLALEAVRLLATLPQPKTELDLSDALEFLGVGLLIPTWAIWGEVRGGWGSGWLKEDFDRLVNIITRKDK